MSSITGRPARRSAPLTDDQISTIRYLYNKTIGVNADVLRGAKLAAYEKKRDAYVALGYAPSLASELALRPTKFKMADAAGKVFEHEDRAYLAIWIAERNRTLRTRT